jgi:hypothetical protein
MIVKGNIQEVLNDRKLLGIRDGFKSATADCKQELVREKVGETLLKEALEYAKRNSFDIIYNIFTLVSASKVIADASFTKTLKYDILTLRSFLPFSRDDFLNNITTVITMRTEKRIE